MWRKVAVLRYGTTCRTSMHMLHTILSFGMQQFVESSDFVVGNVNANGDPPSLAMKLSRSDGNFNQSGTLKWQDIIGRSKDSPHDPYIIHMWKDKSPTIQVYGQTGRLFGSPTMPGSTFETLLKSLHQSVCGAKAWMPGRRLQHLTSHGTSLQQWQVQSQPNNDGFVILNAPCWCKEQLGWTGITWNHMHNIMSTLLLLTCHDHKSTCTCMHHTHAMYARRHACVMFQDACMQARTDACLQVFMYAYACISVDV